MSSRWAGSQIRSSQDKQELLGLIEAYRQGLLLPIVPLTLPRTGSSIT
jgi:uncharacterized protein YbgA (DUF1722 family)